MKNLTNDVILAIAKNLVNQNGSTTTLDVKLEARAQGYFAQQHTVSKCMYNEHRTVGLDFVQSGDHRSYTLSDTTSMTQSPTTNTDFLTSSEVDAAIKLCESNGLVYASTMRQYANGTLYFTDPASPSNAYSITKKGYARRYMLNVGYCGVTEGYQLNRVVKENDSYVRILLPGQYLELAKMVVRIANKNR